MHQNPVKLPNGKDLFYCKTCLTPSSRPGMQVNDDGVCTACQWYEKKKKIDWDLRASQLQKIADWAKSRSRSQWDCVLGVSGGKDSLWQAHQLRDRFGLNPLLVMFVGSDVTDLGRMNAENMVECGFTVLSVQPNPQIAAKLAKKSFVEHGNIAKFSELALFTTPFRTAIEYKIPLVFFGENPALETGDVNVTSAGWDASGIRFNNTLSGAALDLWLDPAQDITEKELIPYTFPSVEELKDWAGRGVFMGYFLNWSGWDHAVFSMAHGMSHHTASYDDIGGAYLHNALDTNSSGTLNYMLKYFKFGFGEASEQLCYEIRSGMISRLEGAALAKRLDGKAKPQFIDDFCKWIDIDKNTFWDVANGYRGKMWELDGQHWKHLYPVYADYDQNELSKIDTDALLKKIDTISVAKSKLRNDIQMKKIA